MVSVTSIEGKMCCRSRFYFSKCFLYPGCPCILQSDNGKEFDNKLLLVTLNELWPPTKIIHGKPRHPQSQGSVESANKRVENIITSLLEKFQHSNWVSELEKVAYMKNTTVHSVCKNSPYRILYNRDPPKGLRDFNLPEELHHSINSVEDLKALYPYSDNEPRGQFEINQESHSATTMINKRRMKLNLTRMSMTLK